MMHHCQTFTRSSCIRVDSHAVLHRPRQPVASQQADARRGRVLTHRPSVIIGPMDQYRWLIFALLGAMASAVIAPLGKKGIEGLDSNVVTAVRSVAQAMVVLIVVTVMGLWGNLRHFNGRAFGLAGLAGLAG